MRSGAFRILLVLLVGLAGLCGGASVRAQSKDTDLFARPDDFRTVLFGSLEAGRAGFLTLGYKQTLAGPLDRTGPVAMTTVGYGRNPERAEIDTGPTSVLRHTTQAASMIGYQWAVGRLFVAGFVGSETDAQQQTIKGAFARAAQPRFGLRLQGELWLRPTDDTFATAALVAGSARGHLWGRAALGYRVWGDLFVGPEASASLTDAYCAWRLGAHVTGVPVGRFVLGLSGGWQREEDSPRRGPYATLSATIRM